MRYAVVIENAGLNFSAHASAPGCVATGATLAESETAIREVMSEQRVVVVDVNMKFGTMAVFLVKLAIAFIPAAPELRRWRYQVLSIACLMPRVKETSECSAM